MVGRPDLIAAAAWQTPPTRRARCTGDSLRLLIAPLVSGAVGLELLLYASMGDLNPLAVGLAAAALVFVMIRLTLTFRQNVGILRASRDEALTDALTGLGNRRALTRELDDALPAAQPRVAAGARAVRPRRLQALQRHLRPPGRRRAAGAPRRNLRAYFDNRARVFRMGGDEFCALFEPRGADPTMLLDGASLALSEQGDGFWIGCSYGAVIAAPRDHDASEALRIADQRMYAQKHAGRMSAGRQVKETLVAALAVRDPRFEAEARALSEVADAAARTLGLNRDERESVRLAAELRQVGRLVATRPEDVAVASERIVSAAPALTSVARLLRALDQNNAPVGAQIVAAAAEHRLDRSDPRFDPAVVEAVTRRPARPGLADPHDDRARVPDLVREHRRLARDPQPQPEAPGIAAELGGRAPAGVRPGRPGRAHRHPAAVLERLEHDDLAARRQRRPEQPQPAREAHPPCAATTPSPPGSTRWRACAATPRANVAGRRYCPGRRSPACGSGRPGR